MSREFARRKAKLVLPVLLAFGVGAQARAADLIELLSGAKVEGAVSNIDKAKQQVTITRKVGERSLTATYPYSRIHAVTLQGKRYVLNEKTDAPAARPAPSRTTPAEREPRGPAGGSGTSRSGIQALIEQQGKTPPDWFEETPLNYPKSLDLAWPEPAPKGWNNQQNIGQYLWDIINPNPAKWKEGVRFLHHLLTLHKDNSELQLRIMNSLGRAYYDLLQDYARAAFWWQQAGVQRGDSRFFHSGPTLGLCYFRLGSKAMAAELFEKLERSSATLSLVKAWGDIGEPRRATQLTEGFIRGSKPDMHAVIYQQAGDACRANGLYPQAIQYYQKALNAPASEPNKPHVVRQRQRAQENIDAIKLFELCDVTRVPDGVYKAGSMGYEDLVHVAVTVKGGRIESVEITQHHEKQFYAAMIETPAKIIARQGVKGIDTTSSATLTSEAIVNATAKALAGARN